MDRKKINFIERNKMNLTKDKKTSRTTIKDVTNVRSADAG